MCYGRVDLLSFPLVYSLLRVQYMLLWPSHISQNVLRKYSDTRVLHPSNIELRC